MPLTEIAVKEYTALIDQNSANAPTATILNNTLGDIVWTRTDIGEYTGTLTNTFPEHKTFITFTKTWGSVQDVFIFWDSVSTIKIQSFSGGNLQDSVLYIVPLKIQVYNI